MTSFADVADLLRQVRKEARLRQRALAQSAGVLRTTVARMETLAKGDMSVSAVAIGSGGYDLKPVKRGYGAPLGTSSPSSVQGMRRET